MPEVGLVHFARVALDVVDTSYRTAFSNHQSTQLELFAILCLTHYDDWTYRDWPNARNCAAFSSFGPFRTA